MSQPAQLPPKFSFTTEDGVLEINSTDLKLIANITDADNNNDGLVDNDYLYRLQIDSTWTNWTTISSLINHDLSSITSGTYQVTMEVKNMYGVVQDQITIQYTAPPPISTSIPGYSTLIIAVILVLGVSTILFKFRKKTRTRN